MCIVNPGLCGKWNVWIGPHYCKCSTSLIYIAWYTRLQYTRLQYIRLQYIRLQYTRLQYTRLQYIRLQYIRLQYIRLWYIRLQYIRLWYIKLQYDTSDYNVIHQTTMWYIRWRCVMCNKLRDKVKGYFKMCVQHLSTQNTFWHVQPNNQTSFCVVFFTSSQRSSPSPSPVAGPSLSPCPFCVPSLPLPVPLLHPSLEPSLAWPHCKHTSRHVFVGTHTHTHTHTHTRTHTRTHTVLQERHVLATVAARKKPITWRVYYVLLLTFIIIIATCTVLHVDACKMCRHAVTSAERVRNGAYTVVCEERARLVHVDACKMCRHPVPSGNGQKGSACPFLQYLVKYNKLSP